MFVGDAVPLSGLTVLEGLLGHSGVSENRGPYYSTLNRRILIIRPPNKVPLIFGNSHSGLRQVRGALEFRIAVAIGRFRVAWFRV